MQPLRSLLFDGIFYAGTCITLFLLLPFLLLPRSFIQKAVCLWGRGFLLLSKYVLGLDYHVTGLPKAPSLIASKHQSAWETFAFVGLVQKPVFVLKHSLFYIPLFGLYLKKLGMIGVRRGKKQGAHSVIQQANQATMDGSSVIIFPEGTRTRPGTTPPLKRGAWNLYKGLNLPTYGAFLNSGLFWPRKSVFKKPGTIHIHFQKMSATPKPETFLSQLHKALNMPKAL